MNNKDKLIIEISRLRDLLCSVCLEGQEESSIGNCVRCGISVCEYHSWGEADDGLLCDDCGIEEEENG